MAEKVNKQKKKIELYDTSVVKHYNALELEVLEYAQTLRELAKQLLKDEETELKESARQQELFKWFTFGEEANQWYNYLSESLTQARFEKAFNAKMIREQRDRAYKARNDFFEVLHDYYEKVSGFRNLSDKTAFPYLEYVFQYVDTIRHSADEPELTGFETVLRTRRTIENYYGSLNWLGKDATKDPEELRKLLVTREEIITKAMEKDREFQKTLGTVATDLHMSNSERQKLGKALKIKIPKIKA